MGAIVTVVVSILGIVIVTMTAPPIVAIATVCAIVALGVVLAKATGKV